jgi:hypothetical protein
VTVGKGPKRETDYHNGPHHHVVITCDGRFDAISRNSEYFSPDDSTGETFYKTSGLALHSEPSLALTKYHFDITGRRNSSLDQRTIQIRMLWTYFGKFVDKFEKEQDEVWKRIYAVTATYLLE